MEDKSVNRIIPKLLLKSEDYKKSFKKRIKINNIFTEFDHKANDQLRNFINESKKRYKGIKSGNHLDTLVRNSSEKYETFAKKILTDNFYVNLNIDKEKEILRTKTDKKVMKEVTDLMKEVKQYSSSLPKSQIKSLNKQIVKNNTISKVNSSIKDSKVSNESKTTENNQSFDEKKKIVVDLVDSDHKRFISDMNDYSTYLNQLKDNLDMKDSVHKPYEAFHLKDSLKMLTFRKASTRREVQKKEESKTIDMKKLLKFSKLGKNIVTLHEHDKEEIITDYYPHQIVSNRNYKDIISLVKNEANNGVFLQDILEKKKQSMDEKLKHFELPDIDEYDTIVKQKLNREKINRKRRLRRKTINMTDALIEPEELLRMNIIAKRNKIVNSSLFVTSNNYDY